MAVIKLVRKPNSERGAAMIEYTMIAAMFAVVALAGLTYLGKSARASFETVGDQMARTSCGDHSCEIKPHR